MSKPRTAPTSRLGEWWQSKPIRRFRRNPLAITGFILLLGFVFIAVFAGPITEIGRSCMRDLGLSAATQADYRNPLKKQFWQIVVAPPDSCYMIPRNSFAALPQNAEQSGKVLGTTTGGYDIFYGLIWGARSAFKIGLIVVGFSMIAGLVIGSVSGFFGGWVDNLMMRITDVVISLPSLVVSLVVVMVLGKSLENLMFAISLTAWPNYARLMRGEVLQVKEADYVVSARAIGRSRLGVLMKHVIPNAVGPMIIIASLDIGAVVLTAAALSFLGLGVEIGYADWGQMISFARDWILGPPGQPFAYLFVSFWPGLIIVLFVLAWNLMGDAFRDVLDPRGR